MAVGDESIGFGATVEIDDGGSGATPGGGAYAEVDMVTTVTVPSIKTGTTESKRLALARVRKIATIEDGGEFSVKQQFTHAGWARMEAHRAGKHRCSYRVTVPDDDGDTEVTVVGIITENKTDGLEADKITEFETMVTVAE